MSLSDELDVYSAELAGTDVLFSFSFLLMQGCCSFHSSSLPAMLPLPYPARIVWLGWHSPELQSCLAAQRMPACACCSACTGTAQRWSDNPLMHTADLGTGQENTPRCMAA